jgi:hypothetical protein
MKFVHHLSPDYIQDQEQSRDLSVIEDLLDSLKSTDQDGRHATIKEIRIPGTGGWLLTSKKFLKWCATPEKSRVLWGVRIPGLWKIRVGVSVSCSQVIARRLPNR